jgi:hypothetical protein
MLIPHHFTTGSAAYFRIFQRDVAAGARDHIFMFIRINPPFTENDLF